MDDFVSFPETFDLSPYLAPNRNDYKLSPTPTGLRAPYMEWPSPEHGPETQEPVMYRLYGESARGRHPLPDTDQQHWSFIWGP